MNRTAPDPKFQPILWEMVVLLWLGHVWLPMEPAFMDDFSHDSSSMMNAETYRSIRCIQIQLNRDSELYLIYLSVARCQQVQQVYH